LSRGIALLPFSTRYFVAVATHRKIGYWATRVRGKVVENTLQYTGSSGPDWTRKRGQREGSKCQVVEVRGDVHQTLGTNASIFFVHLVYGEKRRCRAEEEIWKLMTSGYMYKQPLRSTEKEILRVRGLHMECQCVKAEDETHPMLIL
jgi:hypothetical protein